MEAKHTATPWSAAGNNNDGWSRISQREDLPVAYVRNSVDAEFIVRACNAHDDLVKALRIARYKLKYLHTHYTGNEAAEIYAIEEQASAALAKAEHNAE